MLLYSPRWLFVIPGSATLLLGVAGVLWLMPGPRPLWPVTLDIHTLLMFGQLAIVRYPRSLSWACSRARSEPARDCTGVLLVIGTQTTFSSVFLSILGLRRASYEALRPSI